MAKKTFSYRPMLKNLWLNDTRNFDERAEIRLDWDNDRHHAVKIEPPLDRDKVAKALFDLHVLILSDKNLVK